MLVRTQSSDSPGNVKPDPLETRHYTFANRPHSDKQNQPLMPCQPAQSVEDGSNCPKRSRRGAVEGIALWTNQGAVSKATARCSHVRSPARLRNSSNERARPSGNSTDAIWLNV